MQNFILILLYYVLRNRKYLEYHSLLNYFTLIDIIWAIRIVMYIYGSKGDKVFFIYLLGKSLYTNEKESIIFNYKYQNCIYC